MRLSVIVEKIVIVFFLLLGIAVWVMVADFPFPTFRNIGSSPGIFPWLLGLLLVSLSSLLLVKSIIERIRSKHTEAEIAGFKSVRPVVIVALAILYTVLLPYIGYLLATVLWIFSLFLVFKPKSKIIFPLVFAALICGTYLIFWLYLPVRLPVGLIFD